MNKTHKIKAEVHRWGDDLFSVYAQVRGGSLETGNHNSPVNAKRAFIAMCNRLGMDRNKYYFDELKETP
jgi:hypothetical protein